MGLQRTRPPEGRLESASASTSPGFTLIEVLVAAAVLIVLLLVATSMLFQSRSAYEAMEVTSNRQHTYELVIQSLKYDLSLAGFKGTYPSDLEPGARPFDSGDPLEITAGSVPDSDDITVRYYENRTFDDAVASELVEVRYFVQDGNLHRQESHASDVIFRDVARIEVVSYTVRKAGVEFDTATRPESFSGIELELEFGNGDVTHFTVPVDNLS